MSDLKEKYTKIVMVKWIDSCSPKQWVDEEEAVDLVPDNIVTVGFLIKDTDKFITVSPSIATHQVDAPICIPRPCVQSVTNLAYEA